MIGNFISHFAQIFSWVSGKNHARLVLFAYFDCSGLSIGAVLLFAYRLAYNPDALPSLLLAGFAGFAQCNSNCLLTAFDLRAFAGAWLAGLQRAALVFTHHLGDLGLGFGWFLHAFSLPRHNGCGVALGSAQSHHHVLALP